MTAKLHSFGLARAMGLATAGLLATVALATPLHAAIFRTVDANGNVTFSDQPPPSSPSGAPQAVSEQIELADPNTFVDNTPRLPYEPDAGADDDETGYDELAITSPGQDEVIRENSGNVVIRTRIVPELQPGHTLRLELNGSLAAETVAGGSIYLTNQPRGTHRARLVIENEQGRRLFESEESVYHLQRYSALFNRGTAPGRPRRN